MVPGQARYPMAADPNRRYRPDPVKLPVLPQGRAQPYYGIQPQNPTSQLRVVRHSQGGHSNVSIYHPGQPMPSVARRDRQGQDRVSYNPITHQRYPIHAQDGRGWR